ncbi:NAD(P)H-dependent flavin oxidoreductase [Kitasatospora sp. NBC_01539]|uniref:NAD(P)H-dependent flavin oxidoreductase n=1 Tax=Kitasatospora sp. NBC_01539 TaxID=2903577 RepID=UPI00386017B0
MSAADPADPTQTQIQTPAPVLAAVPAPAEAAARGCRALGTDLPLVQAGMGGIASPALAAAVSDAGALGTVALYRSDGPQSAALIADTARRTGRGFGVNVIPEVAGRVLAEQVRALMETADRPLLLNSYGLPPEQHVREVLAAGHRLLVQVGTAADAAAAADLGAHAIVLQGVEAGGHHLGGGSTADLLAAYDLAPPVFVAGAVATGADLVEALRAGANGALCGTAFVATAESAAHDAYKRALVGAGPGDTVVTERFSIGWPGRSHRVLRSPVTEAAEPPPATFVAWTTVMGARRPVPRGSAAAPTVEADGRVDEMARYAGLGCGRVTAIEPAAVVVARFRAEYRQALAACASPAR